MAHDLITIPELQARMKKTFADPSAELTQAEAFIADASALVREIAETDFHDPDTGDPVTMPVAIRPVLVAMVRRAIEVPVGAAAGLSSETFPAYSWAGGGGFEGGQPAASLYATRRERSIIRKAAGVLPVTSIATVTDFAQEQTDAEEEVVI